MLGKESKIDIFNYLDYRQYLVEKIEYESEVTKGLKSKIATSLNCHPSYLSQVLNAQSEFSLEQALSFATFFNLDEGERRYFMLMVEHARAGTIELKNFFFKQIKDQQISKFNLRNRLAKKFEISEEDQYRYYRVWYPIVIHVMLSIKENQDLGLIANKLNLPISTVEETVQFLIEIGLIEKNNESYQFTTNHIYLGSDSKLIGQHHLNWRLQAIRSIELNRSEDLHYSVVTAISKEGYMQMKEIFVAAIKESNKIMKDSPEEEVYCIALDLFKATS